MSYELRWVEREAVPTVWADITAIPKKVKVLQFRQNMTDEGLKWTPWKDVPVMEEQ